MARFESELEDGTIVKGSVSKGVIKCKLGLDAKSFWKASPIEAKELKAYKEYEESYVKTKMSLVPQILKAVNDIDDVEATVAKVNVVLPQDKSTLFTLNTDATVRNPGTGEVKTGVKSMKAVTTVKAKAFDAEMEDILSNF